MVFTTMALATLVLAAEIAISFGPTLVDYQLLLFWDYNLFLKKSEHTDYRASSSH